MTPEERERHRQRSCEGKRRYRSRDAAMRVVITIAAQQHDETITAYRCRYCKGWHCGHRREAWQS